LPASAAQRGFRVVCARPEVLAKSKHPLAADADCWTEALGS